MRDPISGFHDKLAGGRYIMRDQASHLIMAIDDPEGGI